MQSVAKPNNFSTSVGAGEVATSACPSTTASITIDSEISCNGESDGVLTASGSGGYGALEYVWSTGETTATISGLPAGTYTVTVTPDCGGPDSATETLLEPTPLMGSASVSSMLYCNGDRNGEVSASASGGTSPYTYVWNTGETTATETNLAAGTYTVTITDLHGCTTAEMVNLTEPTALTGSASVSSMLYCNGDTNGEVSASASGGTSPYTYVWNTGETTATETNLAAGTYTVTITDLHGCTTAEMVNLSEPTVLATMIMVDANVSCNGFSNGSLTATGTGATMPYNYLWSNSATTATITGLVAGTYTVTVTDNEGCTSTNSETITEPTSLLATAVVDANVSCNGFSDGSMTVTGTGATMPYNYLWSNSATTATITGLVAGTYTVTVTDNEGCTSTSSETITEPTTLSATAVVDANVSCNGFSDGGATASPTGGTMPYTYQWSNSATTASITGVTAGTYTVTIIDNNGCTASDNLSITEPLSLGVLIDGDQICYQENNGELTANPTGGTPSYTYAWSTGGTTATVSSLSAGTYTVTVTDGNGCTMTETSTVVEGNELTVSITEDIDITCNGGSDGKLTALGAGGEIVIISGPAALPATYDYMWSTGATTPSIEALDAGTYTVTVTDEFGCTASTTGTITEPESLDASVSLIQNASSGGGNDGILTASATGGTTPYTYIWSNGSTTAENNGLSAGAYTVTITDQNGCEDTTSGSVVHLASLGDNVWLDLNEDGVFNENEPGIPGVTIRLFQCAGGEPGDQVGMTLQTDENGQYLFENVLPGEYCLEVDPSTALGGFEGLDFEFTTFQGVLEGTLNLEQNGRGISESFTLAPGENNLSFNIGVIYDACFTPFSLSAINCTIEGATLTWRSINLDAEDELTDHCWKIVVAGAGPQHGVFGDLGLFLDYLGGGISASLIELSICEDDPALAITPTDDPDSYSISYELSSELLQPGTAYWFAVTEVCDGVLAPGNTSAWNFQRTFLLTLEDEGPFPTADPDTEYLWDDYEGYFQTKDDQFELQAEGNKPTCPDESAAELDLKTDGCITVTIKDGESCWPTYLISIDEVALSLGDSEQGGSGTEFTAGTYTFCGYAADFYDVKVELADYSCNPPKTFLTKTVEVPNGMDMEPPKIIVTDLFAGILLADNVAGSTVEDSRDLGTMTLPEGSCSMKSYLEIVGFDNCDGQICEGVSVRATVIEGAENTSPGTQVQIYNLDGEVITDLGVYTVEGCEWIIEVNWAVGFSTVEICMDDSEEGGFSESACVTISAKIEDVVDANIIAQASNFVVPSCSDDLAFVYGFTIVDGCDDEIDATQVMTTATSELTGVSIELDEEYNYQEAGYFELSGTISDPNGVLTSERILAGYFTITYLDDSGTSFSTTAGIGLLKAAEESPPFIIVNGNSFTALACEDGAEVIVGITVSDDCDQMADVLEISGVGGLSKTSTQLNGNSAYFEYSGVLEAGEYDLTAAYPGAEAVTVSLVVEQADNQAPVVDILGNSTFTIPSCGGILDAVWSIQVTDDCDEEIDLDRLCLYLGNAECLPFAFFEEVGFGYESMVEGEGMALLEIRIPVQDLLGDVPFLVTYEDIEGVIGQSEVTLHFEGTPDEEAPVIIYPTETIRKELAPCADNTTEIDFSVSAIDNCSGPVNVALEAPGNNGMSSEPSGDAIKWTITYPARDQPYAITLLATDETGNVTEQIIWVEVIQGPKPPQNLSCNTNLTALLDENCSYFISPDLALEGTFGCLRPEDILIDVDGSGEPVAYGSGLHEFAIYIEGDYFCTGTIVLTDNIPPTITCPATAIDFLCSDIEELSGSLEHTGEPTFNDNCEAATYSWYEEVIYGEDEACDDVQIKRVFTVTDGAGLTDECTQYITIRKPTVGDVIAPEEVVTLNCNDEYELDENNHPIPTVTGGYPYVSGYFDDYNLAQTFCNLAATYRDSEDIEVCANSYKFTRTWTVLDWCEIEYSRTFTQLIKVGDFEDPEVGAPTVDYDWDGEEDILTFSTGPFNCTASFEVPWPIVSDNCSAWSVTTEILAGGETPILTIENTDSRVISGIPLGCHAFRYWVTDACGNQVDLTVPFVVEDQVAPTAICNEDLNITVDNQGYARVSAEDIDEGSWDNCGPVRVEVRRLISHDAECGDLTPFYTEWGEYVDFSCCDVGIPVRIELRVWDDANGDGIWGNEATVETCEGESKLIHDNHNICWLEVTVEDKQQPYCVAPHAQSVSCATLPYDFDPSQIELLEDLFGQAEFADNCPGVTGAENTPVITLDDCGAGTILRSFTATDAAGLTSGTCQQLITIYAVHNYEIGFPADSQADCGVADPDTVLTKQIGCDLLAISSEDELFTASGDECYKIFRTYRVINWCEYDGEAPPVVVSRDEDCDNRPGDEAVWVIRRNSGAVYFDRDNNELNSNPRAGEKGRTCDGLTNPNGYWINSTIDQDATRDPITGQLDNNYTNDNIRNIDSRGYWQYTQVIKVYDSEDPVITVEDYEEFKSLDGANCDAPVTINFSIVDECTQEEGLEYVWLDAFIIDADGDGNFTQAEFISDGDLTDQVSGEAPNYTFSAELPEGQHALLIKGSDGCGNAAVDMITFIVVDGKAPAPVCINGLAIELMPTEPGTDADGDGDEDPAAMAIWANDFIASPIYDCNGQGPAIDEHGNELITAYSINLLGAEASRDDTGLILTCDSEETTLVEIHAWDEAGNHDYCQTYILVQDLMGRCDNGAGAIAGNIETAERMEGIADVTVQISGAMDQVVVTQDAGYYHFQNIPLGSDVSIYPWKDIDPLNGVSTFDLILIGKHILGEVALDTPWKLLAADANNNGAVTTLDVVTIRRLILGIEDSFRGNTSWRFFEESQHFSDTSNPWASHLREIASLNDVGEEVEVNFKGIKTGDVNVSAIANAHSVIDERTFGSFAFEVEDLKMEAGKTYQVEFSAAEMSQIAGYQGTFTFGKAIEVVDIIYGAVQAGNFGTTYLLEGLLTTSWNAKAVADEVLFTLVIQAKDKALLSDQLGLSSRITATEAYNLAGEQLDLALNFSTGKTKEVGFELYQNEPNPFREETLIGYHLPETAQVTFTLCDVTGRTLKTFRTRGAKGYNRIRLGSNDIAAKGILYYTLSTEEFTATRKMIIE